MPVVEDPPPGREDRRYRSSPAIRRRQGRARPPAVRSPEVLRQHTSQSRRRRAARTRGSGGQMFARAGRDTGARRRRFYAFPRRRYALDNLRGSTASRSLKVRRRGIVGFRSAQVCMTTQPDGFITRHVSWRVDVGRDAVRTVPSISGPAQGDPREMQDKRAKVWAILRATQRRPRNIDAFTAISRAQERRRRFLRGTARSLN